MAQIRLLRRLTPFGIYLKKPLCIVQSGFFFILKPDLFCTNFVLTSLVRPAKSDAARAFGLAHEGSIFAVVDVSQ
jgi:hypothetical protein